MTADAVTPSATYRVQLQPRFTFADTAAAVPYLATLGVSHLHLSPVLEAVPGSTHGYDVVDHTRIRAEFGGEQGLRELSRTAREHGLGLILDIVPNHMAVPAPEHLNGPLWQVLRDGPSSPYASWFDIDWAAQDGKVLLPVLGEPLPDAMGRLSVVRDKAAGGKALAYYEHRFPLRPGTEELPLPELLARQWYRPAYWRAARTELNYRRFFTISDLIAVRVERPEVFEATHATVLRLLREGVADGLRIDHPDGLADPTGYLRRLAEASGGRWTVVEKILQRDEELPADWACAGTTGYDALDRVDGLFTDPAGVTAVAAAYRAFTGVEDDLGGDWPRTTRRAAHRVISHDLAAEVTRLRAAAEVAASAVTGSVPPAAPVEATVSAAPGTSAFPGASAEPTESTRSDRSSGSSRSTGSTGSSRSEGSAGSDDPAAAHPNAATLPTPSAEPTTSTRSTGSSRSDGSATSDDPAAAHPNAATLPTPSAEPTTSTGPAGSEGSADPAAGHPDAAGSAALPYGPETLAEAIRELLVRVPVYRPYVPPSGPATAGDVALLERAAAEAREECAPELGPALDFVRDLALGRVAARLAEPTSPTPAGAVAAEAQRSAEAQRGAAADFVSRFAQVASALHAKSVEDAAFYRYVPLVSLCEVGRDPGRPGVTPGEFHAYCERVARDWPGTGTVLSTHDTKRSADLRLRLAVLSERPEAWRRWIGERPERAAALGCPPAPDRHTEYTVFQTAVGLGSYDADRLVPATLKAVREAGLHTTWTEQDEAYEKAVADFTDQGPCGAQADDIAAFTETLRPYAAANTLGAALLHLTMPGVPDVYQGTEWPVHTLVDPDNRGPMADPRDAVLHGLLEGADPRDPAEAKLRLTAVALRLRRDHPEWYGPAAGYAPLAAAGPAAEHCVAFVRGGGALTVVTRLSRRLEEAGGWRDTALALPPGRWHDRLTGTRHEGRVPLADLLAHSPVALLTKGAAV
jgi:(1->4)-alpha-D-glucan 1-alpha-D-glucosylmutase